MTDNNDIYANISSQYHDTWNDCPICKKNWKELKTVPGIIHRTRLCDDCKIEEAIKNDTGTRSH